MRILGERVFFVEREKKNAIFAFLLISLAILISAMNITLGHFIVDLNLGKAGLPLIPLGLGLLVWRDVPFLWKDLKGILWIIIGWTGYLFINALMGPDPVASFKMITRFIVVWVLSLELFLLLRRDFILYSKSVFYALLFGLAFITLFWFLSYQDRNSLSWFIEKLPDYTTHRVNGLYVNPNELGFALAAHSLVLLLFLPEKAWSRYLFSMLLVLNFVGISLSESRNAFFGICWIAFLFLMRSIYQLNVSKKNKIIICGIIGLVLFLAILLMGIKGKLPSRMENTVTRIILNASEPNR